MAAVCFNFRNAFKTQLEVQFICLRLCTLSVAVRTKTHALTKACRSLHFYTTQRVIKQATNTRAELLPARNVLTRTGVRVYGSSGVDEKHLL